MGEKIMLNPEELVFASGTQTAMDRQIALRTAEAGLGDFVSNLAVRENTPQGQNR